MMHAEIESQGERHKKALLWTLVVDPIKDPYPAEA